MYNNSQQELISKIENIIKNTDYRTVKENICLELKKRNLDSSIIILASQIIMNNAKVEQLVDNDNIKLLFFFTDALNKALINNKDANIINLENYFLKSEIEELGEYIEKKENKSIFPIVIYDVTQFNDHHWEGSISSKYQHELNNYRIPFYNPKTQRNPRRTKNGDKINLDINKVLEIKNDLIEGKYETDAIIWNILKTGDEKFVYNSKNRTLTIYEGSIINIVDGMHRKEANSAVMIENPDFEFKWVLSIVNVSEIKAHDIMVQKNKQSKMPDEWISTKDYNKEQNDVLSKMADERSTLFKIMGDEERQISKEQALVKKVNIALAIKENYEKEILDNDDRRQIARWLSEFFDYMLKLYSYDFFEKPYEVKKESFINWKNMFYGYVALSKHLYQKENWREILKTKMSSLDFNINNSLWQNLGMKNTKDANSALRTKLYNIFKEDIE